MAGSQGIGRGRGRKKVDQAALDAANEASRNLGKQQQATGKTTTKAAKAGEAPKRGGRKAAEPQANGLGKQQQSAAPAAAAPPAAAATKPKQKRARNPGTHVPRGPGKQTQTDGAAGAVDRQGATASGKGGDDTSGELRGGTKQVLITDAVIFGRGGRPRDPEEYPFSALKPAHKDPDGRIVGPSFFIPMADRAEGRLASARKREKALFWSRKVKEQVNGRGQPVEGLRIWRGTPELVSEV
jgi:hypothetical protein